MAILTAKDVARLDDKNRREKLKELRLELIKANVTANRSNAKTKEIKKAIARLITKEKMVQEKNMKIFTKPQVEEVNKH